MDNYIYILEYRGRAVSFTFDLYSGLRITLRRGQKHIIKSQKPLSKEVVQYYKSLAPEIIITKVNNNQKSNDNNKEIVVQEKQNISNTEVVDTISLIREISDNVEDTPDEEDLVVGGEDLSRDILDKDSMSKSDLCEYLDMNYSEEAIKDIADNLNVNIKRLRSKDSMIYRIVEEKFEEVIKLINK